MAARRRRAAVDRPQRSAAAGVARGSPPGGGRPNRDAGVDVEEGAHRRSAARQGRPLHGRQRREVDVGEGGGEGSMAGGAHRRDAAAGGPLARGTGRGAGQRGHPTVRRAAGAAVQLITPIVQTIASIYGRAAAGGAPRQRPGCAPTAAEAQRAHGAGGRPCGCLPTSPTMSRDLRAHFEAIIAQ